MNINAKITISRNSNDIVRIAIKDTASLARFVEVEMTPHDFAMAITGLSEIPVTGTVRELHIVGQNKVSEPRTVVCPLTTYEKKEVLRAWVLEHCQEPGWSLSVRLDTQGSVTNNADGTKTLRYSVYRYERDNGDTP
jgi:hypothetical protein